MGDLGARVGRPHGVRVAHPQAHRSQGEALVRPRGRGGTAPGRGAVRYSRVRLSHHRGHCSFHSLLKEYKLDDPVLVRMARIIDEADTVQEVHVEPAAAGLDLICEGLRQISPDDVTALERGAMVYDALYAGLLLEMEGRSHVSS